jgi:hypothetical protein
MFLIGSIEINFLPRELYFQFRKRETVWQNVFDNKPMALKSKLFAPALECADMSAL